MIKHSDSGNLILHFYATVRSAAAVLALFDELMELLGQGSHAIPVYTFHNKELVQAFAIKEVNELEQVIGHIWLFGKYSFNIGYRSDPPHQLVFTDAKTTRNAIDYSPRDKVTLVSILRYGIDDILTLQELYAIPLYENDKVKYIDYTFSLDPPEFGVFDRVKVRIFDAEKRTDKGLFHLTYCNRFELRPADIITLSNQIFKIYGSDSTGDKELAPYEVDHIEAYKNWQGRSWWKNLKHTIKNDKDEQDSILYWLYFHLDPDEDGFALHVVGFNDMLDYHRNHFLNALRPLMNLHKCMKYTAFDGLKTFWVSIRNFRARISILLLPIS